MYIGNRNPMNTAALPIAFQSSMGLSDMGGLSTEGGLQGGDSLPLDMLSGGDKLKPFAKLLEQTMAERGDGRGKNTNETMLENGKKGHREQLREAAKQMEIQLVTMMFKTMEKASSENGMLGGGKSAGMAHFKDLFFQNVAEEVVNGQGLGFAESLINSYEHRVLKP